RQVEVLLTNLLARQAWFALRLYRFEPAWALFQWSIELIERLGPSRETLVAELLANNPTATGGHLRSEARLQEQLARVRATGDAWLIALALNGYAFTLPTRAAGQAVLEEALAVCRAAGDQRGIASNLDTLASVTREGAQLGRAVAYWEEARAIYRDLGYRWAYAYCLDQMGYAQRHMGDLGQAEQLHRESLEASRAIGDRLGVAGSLDNLALVALERADLEAAERLAREGLAIREAVRHTLSTRISLLSLAKIAAARGDHSATRALLDACQSEIPADQEWLHCRAIQLRARLAFDEGDLSATLLLLHTALDLVADNWRLLDQLMIMGDLAEAYLAAGDAPLAAELAATALAHGADIRRLRQRAESVLARTGPPDHMRPPEELLSDLRR
ncbi:MAG: tetratricopeptide repeat protein, partial [Chloroflexales bacterium]|nr:tetratricopeptide repeat protein [Chloroflexales bacterium]